MLQANGTSQTILSSATNDYTLEVQRGTPMGKYYVKYTKNVYNGTPTPTSVEVSEYAEFNVVD